MQSRKGHKRIAMVVLRVLVAVPGAFGFTTAFVALSSVVFALGFGMARGEAVLLSAMLGFLFYLASLLWAFAAPRLMPVWIVFLGGGAAAYALVSWLAPMLTVPTGTGS